MHIIRPRATCESPQFLKADLLPGLTEMFSDWSSHKLLYISAVLKLFSATSYTINHIEAYAVAQ
jgi:hypothetical protein